MTRWLSLLCVELAVFGCGSSRPVGIFNASVEPVAGTDAAAIEAARTRLANEPEALTVRADGTFSTMHGGKIIWEGSWRSDGDRLILRSIRASGVDVLPEPSSREVA
ncbi:MAG TPA: hypothetical protein PLL78_06320 [Fimbriimonadaceae bacterium]|nr:hypothetical protein [Fimbriimonadaceae bacterium]HRJ96283.1 hypothetical protein [Fimbriimonadaceae bacterium]